MADVLPLVPEPDEAPSAPPPQRAPDHDLGAMAQAVARAALGAVALALGATVSVVRHAAGTPEPARADKDPAAVLAGAALGFASEALRTAAALADAGMRTFRPLAAAGGASAEPLRRGVEQVIRRWDDSWERERPETEALAAAVAGEATHRAVAAILDQLDLNEIVAERVDLDRIVAGLDIDAVVARIDVDELVRGLDVDALADRIDVDRVIARLDLTALALDVIERIDLPEIIRASTGAVGSETVRSVRMDAVAADDAITRVVDRLLGRRRDDGS